jgi:hypothetical protein
MKLYELSVIIHVDDDVNDVDAEAMCDDLDTMDPPSVVHGAVWDALKGNTALHKALVNGKATLKVSE